MYPFNAFFFCYSYFYTLLAGFPSLTATKHERDVIIDRNLRGVRICKLFRTPLPQDGSSLPFLTRCILPCLSVCSRLPYSITLGFVDPLILPLISVISVTVNLPPQVAIGL